MTPDWTAMEPFDAAVFTVGGMFVAIAITSTLCRRCRAWWRRRREVRNAEAARLQSPREVVAAPGLASTRRGVAETSVDRWVRFDRALADARRGHLDPDHCLSTTSLEFQVRKPVNGFLADDSGDVA